jgi:hypothetical protein
MGSIENADGVFPLRIKREGAGENIRRLFLSKELDFMFSVAYIVYYE